MPAHEPPYVFCFFLANTSFEAFLYISTHWAYALFFVSTKMLKRKLIEMCCITLPERNARIFIHSAIIKQDCDRVPARISEGSTSRIPERRLEEAIFKI